MFHSHSQILQTKLLGGCQSPSETKEPQWWGLPSMAGEGLSGPAGHEWGGEAAMKRTAEYTVFKQCHIMQQWKFLNLLINRTQLNLKKHFVYPKKPNTEEHILYNLFFYCFWSFRIGKIKLLWFMSEYCLFFLEWVDWKWRWGKFSRGRQTWSIFWGRWWLHEYKHL